MPKVKQRLITCWEREEVLLDATRAAMLLGVSVQQVRKLAREGQIPAVKLGVKLWRFNKYALMEWAGVKEVYPMKNDNTSIEYLCESARNSIEAINAESADERSGAYVSMQDIFSD